MLEASVDGVAAAMTVISADGATGEVKVRAKRRVVGGGGVKRAFV